ncbi:MAG: universal stress protein [Aquihabitans sp.]
MRRALIATDGSAKAIQAAEEAVALLHPDLEVKLVTVIEAWRDPEEDAGGFGGPLVTPEEAQREWDEARAAGREAILETEESLDNRVTDELVVATSESVADALVRLVEELRPAVLVIGPDQSNWFRRMLGGAVDKQLIHRVTCPLLVMNRPDSDDET